MLLAILISGCQVQQEQYAEQARQMTDTTIDLGGEQNRPSDMAWFAFYGSGRLEGLIGRALSANRSLKVAWNRLAEAQALADAASSRLVPSVELAAGVQRMKQRALPLGFADQAGPAAQRLFPEEAATRKLSVYDLSLAASYEIDLWGRIGSRVEAADLEVEAGYFDYEALAMTLAAAVTRSWLRLESTQRQLGLLDDQLRVLHEQLRLNDRRLGSGLIRGFEVSRQEQRLHELQGAVATTRLEKNLAFNQLARLLGEAPQRFDYEAAGKLPPLPPQPPVGPAVDLLQRRPDVQAAYARLLAGDKRVAAAIADQLPKLRIGGELFTNATDISSLGEVLLWTLQAGIETALYDGGYDDAQVAAAKARTRQALHEYLDTVVQAYAEVDDALDSEAEMTSRVTFLREQLQAARRGVELSEASYVNGALPYESFLEALMRWQRLEIVMVQAREQQLLYRLQLHRALGGRWPEDFSGRIVGEADEK